MLYIWLYYNDKLFIYKIILGKSIKVLLTLLQNYLCSF